MTEKERVSDRLTLIWDRQTEKDKGTETNGQVEGGGGTEQESERTSERTSERASEPARERERESTYCD